MATERTDLAVPDFEAIARSANQLAEAFRQTATASLKPFEPTGQGGAFGGGAFQGAKLQGAEEIDEMTRTLTRVAETWMKDPEKALQAQAKLNQSFAALWASTISRMQGAAASPVAQPEAKDKRFAHADWTANPIFDIIKQSYLILGHWAEELVEKAEGIDEHTRHKAEFYLRQLLSAYSPSNFVMTNPELLRQTLEEGGANLMRGMKMLQEDLQAGGGQLRVRQTDLTAFTFGGQPGGATGGEG